MRGRALILAPHNLAIHVDPGIIETGQIGEAAAHF
jgi:hypothetical protein